MLSGVIQRKPWAVIAAWIIIVALLAPAAARLDSVVKTETTEFLPSGMESVRAEQALNELYNKTGATRMQADYLVMVHGVEVSLDTYTKLKDPYYRAVGSVNGSVLSWIDIVGGIEENATAGVRQGLNASLQLVGASLQVNQGYIAYRSAVVNLTLLVSGLDKAYVSLLRNVSMMAKQGPGLVNATRALATACSFQKTELAMLYDVARTEALLETNTTAYEQGLTPQDIALVVELTNLSSYGIPPVDPLLVAAIYNATTSAGGPANFSNELAAELAYNLALAGMRETLDNETLQQLTPLLEAVHQAVLQVVSQLPDLRGPIYQYGPVNGQLALRQLIDNLTATLVPQTLQDLAAHLGQQAGTELVEEIAGQVLEAGCDASSAPRIAAAVLASALASAGVPGDVAVELAVDAVNGTVNRSLVLAAAERLVAAQSGAPEAVISVAGLLVETYDPAGMGSLTNGSMLTAAAAYLALVASGAELPVSLVQQLSHSDDPVFEAFKLMLNGSRGPDAVALAMVLYRAGLLGSDNATLLRALPDTLASLMAEQGGISAEQARELLAAAVAVYTGQLTSDEAIKRIVHGMLEEAWPRIVERIRGVLVEKDLGGFIVLYQPGPGASMDEAVRGLDTLAKALDSALQEAGYQGYTLMRGGTEFMTYEMKEAVLRDVERSDRMSMVFVLLVMAIVLESVAAVVLPFIGIGFGLIASMALVFALAKLGLIDVTTHSRTIMYSTGLGLGIDYAVYVARSFREAAAEGLPSREAAAEAFRRSWRPVIAGAATAMIGFGSMLLAADFPFISSIGATVPLTILLVMLASITFIPALLAYVGEKGWFWWPRHPTNRGIHEAGAAFRRLGRAVVRAAPALLALAVVLGIAGYAVVSGYEGSYDLSLNLPEDTESYRFLQAFNEYYDPGVLYPVYIVASSPEKAQAINETVSGLECVAHTRVDERLEGRVVFAYMSVNPMSSEGVECASIIREQAHRVDPGSLVGGLSASNLDFKEAVTSIFYGKVYPVAIALMFLTMLLAYGGVLTALSAVLGVVAAAYLGSALAIIVYERLLGTPVLWYLPVITFTAILGVGMDYNSFYLARARRECDKECSRDSVARSVASSTLVVLGLATIMASAYLGLALTKTPGIASMGLALLMGVLAAGVYSSILLTPPLIALLGRLAWWPRAARKR